MNTDARFELRDHTADVGIAAEGATLDSVFGALGDGLAAAQCDDIPDGGERFSFSLAAEGREALLFDYLDELIYERDVRSVLPVDNEVRIEADEEWRLEASSRGVPLADLEAREVKAVTYSEMRIEEHEEGWEAYVVLDV
ncbi:protein archease [Halalkalicoccus paucihalophilus]|uniref:Protein archease n=1 Tax=Halalkalicoccus paucihalophilus TaxID=1008153 RepID=A0A151AGA8_9EURY|nr:archease [Halalkalicoccus paucihalophilus]KYH26635.1 protein archease [Halalkalicoccus paucihalophilus]